MIRALVGALAAMIACGRVGFDPAGDGGPRTVAFRASQSGSDIGALGLDVPLAIGAAPSAVLVTVATRNSDMQPPPVSSVAIGGVPFEKLVSLCPGCTTGSLNNFELWMVVDPPPGARTVHVSLAGQADGVSAVASSYATFAGISLDIQASSDGMTPSPSLAWTASADSVWAIAAAMNQGGFTIMFAPRAGQAERAPSLCDIDEWEGQTADDQVVANGPIAFDWTIGGGNAPPCDPTPGSHAWIAIGASFK